MDGGDSTILSVTLDSRNYIEPQCSNHGHLLIDSGRLTHLAAEARGLRKRAPDCHTFLPTDSYCTVGDLYNFRR